MEEVKIPMKVIDCYGTINDCIKKRITVSSAAELLKLSHRRVYNLKTHTRPSSLLPPPAICLEM
ncbi:MAG: hypothetical protein Kow0090_03370 [Myxococcota bacterium]